MDLGKLALSSCSSVIVGTLIVNCIYKRLDGQNNDWFLACDKLQYLHEWPTGGRGCEELLRIVNKRVASAMIFALY